MRLTKRRVVWLCMLATGACASGSAAVNDAAVATQQDAASVQTIASSWAYWNRSLADLKTNSDIGVEATVTSIVQSDPPPAVAPPFRTITVAVTKEIWKRDDNATVPATISFEQTGGPHLVVEGDPPIEPDADYILFLQEYAPGSYRLSPSSRFAVSQDGIVTPVVNDGIQLPAGTTVDTFPKL